MSKSAWSGQGGPVGWSRLALRILLELIEARSISTLAEANSGVAGLSSTTVMIFKLEAPGGGVHTLAQTFLKDDDDT